MSDLTEVVDDDENDDCSLPGTAGDEKAVTPDPAVAAVSSSAVANELVENLILSFSFK